MNFSAVFEKVQDAGFPPGYYSARVPTVGLTTHGLGIEGARQAAADLLRLWLAEKKSCGEAVYGSSETLIGTLEIPDDALQGA